MIAVNERAQAVTRAKKALEHVEAHRAATKSNLGAARDQLNIVHNCTSAHDVWDAIHGLEGLVVDIYGGIPSIPTDRTGE